MQSENKYFCHVKSQLLKYKQVGKAKDERARDLYNNNKKKSKRVYNSSPNFEK